MVRPNKKKLSRKRITYKSKKPHKHTKKQNKRLKQPKKTKIRKTKRKTRQSKRKSRKLKGGNGPRGTEVVNNPVSEDMTQNTQNNTLAANRLDAQDEINSVYNNPTHAYFDQKNPEHKVAVERMRQLMEKVHGN